MKIEIEDRPRPQRVPLEVGEVKGGLQKNDPLTGSAQPNESFHTVKGRYTDKRLNFTTSAEVRFALGVISESRNRDWQDELRKSLDISPFPTECSKMPWDLNSKRQRKTERRREEPERRKSPKPEMRRGQGRLGAARERTTTTSGSSLKTLQTKPKKNNSVSH
jgi:hypothetical protein